MFFASANVKGGGGGAGVTLVGAVDCVTKRGCSDTEGAGAGGGGALAYIITSQILTAGEILTVQVIISQLLSFLYFLTLLL